MATNKKAIKYDESKITTLSSLEHIRLRTGMYIGRLGSGTDCDDGIYVLLKEIVDNAVDEFIMGAGKKVDVTVEGGTVTVRDYGRGIPLGKVVECVSIINTGAKYNSDVFQFSVGLNGVGTKAVNALSSHFRVVAFREGKFSEAIFERGNLLRKRQGKAPREPDGTYVEFTPDENIFGEHEFNMEFVESRMWNYACLNSGLKLICNGQEFLARNGLLDFLDKEVGDAGLYDLVHWREGQLEFAFTHTINYGETYFSFVNGQYTNGGGTHQQAFREGVLKGINEFYRKSHTPADVRDGFLGAVAVKLTSPIFESQTKNKLGNTNIRGWIVGAVKEAVVDFLHKNMPAAKLLESKISQNEKLRKELGAVKKEARAAAKRISIKIPNLRDCKFHLDHRKHGEDTTLFITEGASATGSMMASRNALTQAVFSLKGKPRNVFGQTRAAIYKNVELYNLMMSLGIEDSFEGLRYNRIIIATDADVDGFHIRNLLLTFFLNYYEELVVAGHVHMLETPLFRVRNKKTTCYCYSESERNDALKAISSPEVTRFKGLGEISPNEFGQFIGEDIRLVRVAVEHTAHVPETLTFYMGKNTPERRTYIMENLV